jgi:NitT/TauT family transport system substrate-binding protein
MIETRRCAASARGRPPWRLALLAALALSLFGCAAPAVSPAPPAGGAPAPAAGAPAAPAAAPAASSPGPAAAPQSITLAITSPTALYWPVYIAQAEGFFAREGVEAELIYTSSGVRSVQTLAGGSADIAIPGPDAVLTANAKGAELYLISGGVHSVLYSMIAQPDIRSVADLRDMTVGVSGVKGGNALVMRRLLERAGLQPDRDYQLVVVGGTPDAIAALRAKGVQAILALQPQDLQLQDDGFPRIAGSAEILPRYAFVTVASRGDWLRANRPAAVKFLRALIAGEHWFYERQNRAKAVEILADASRIEPRYVERTYDLYVEDGGVIPRNGEIDDASVQAVIDVLLGDGDLDAVPRRETYRDDSFLQEALAR